MKAKCIVILLTVSGLLAAAPAASPTTLCESAPSPSVCPAGERYAIPQKIQAGLAAKTIFKIVEGGITVECNESKFAGETWKNMGIESELKTTIGVWTLGNKGGECAVAGGAECKSTEWPIIPAEVWLLSAGGNGTMVFEKPAEIKFDCAGIKCMYATNALVLEFTGGAAGEAQLNANGLEFAKVMGSNVLCAATAKVTAELAISEPTKALWITKAP